MTSPKDILVVSAAYSEIQRRSAKTVGQLSAEAARKAIAVAGLKVHDIDGLANFPSPSRPGAGALDGVDIASPVYMAQALGLSGLRWHTSLTRGSFTASVAEAANALAAGACDYALVWRSMRNPPGKYGRVKPGPVSGDDAFTGPYGFSNEVVKASMIYSRYMHEYGTTRADMAAFAVANRANAAKNPDAVFYEKPITHDEYMNAQPIADPLSLLDCDMAVDGSAAIVMSRRENAPRTELPPVQLVAHLNLGMPPKRRNYYVLEEFEDAAKNMANMVLEQAKMSGGDLTVLQFYDGFVYFPWLWMEAFGIAKRGQAASLMTEGETGPQGRRPLNTSGGSLGMGRIHGGAQVIEAVRQLQGACGSRQIATLGPAVATSGSPLSGCGALIFAPTN
ncbi:thiolase family protein [Jatrophihabitans sp. DSM 45814]